MAAHLAGVVAGKTILPVIGIPMESPHLSGLDSLYSTVMMPPGIPVATVGIGKSGAKNAAYLAVSILALSDEALRERLLAYRDSLPGQVEAMNASVQKKLAERRP
jgi:phosphoribosylaminoimidazole carboxylase PurE protein